MTYFAAFAVISAFVLAVVAIVGTSVIFGEFVAWLLGLS